MGERRGQRLGMVQFATTVICGYGLLLVLLFFFQRSLLYHPDTRQPDPVRWGAADMQPVELATSDGLRLLAWHRPAKEGMPTLLYLHGNGGHIGGRALKARPYLDRGYGVLLVEYRGYGGNPGSPSEAGLYRDGQAGLDFLLKAGVTPGNVVLYGESLGSGIAVEIARLQAEVEPVGALVLEAPYTSLVDVGQAHYFFIPVGLLLRDRFPSIDRIAHVKAPVFILHGEEDLTVPVRLGRRLFEAAAEPKSAKWIPGAGHNGLYQFGAADAVLAFLGGL